MQLADQQHEVREKVLVIAGVRTCEAAASRSLGKPHRLTTSLGKHTGCVSLTSSRSNCISHKSFFQNPGLHVTIEFLVREGAPSGISEDSWWCCCTGWTWLVLSNLIVLLMEQFFCAFLWLRCAEAGPGVQTGRASSRQAGRRGDFVSSVGVAHVVGMMWHQTFVCVQLVVVIWHAAYC